jgi:hypothetical protein
VPALWVELIAWHRQIFGAPQIGGIDPGSKFDEHLARGGDCPRILRPAVASLVP